MFFFIVVQVQLSPFSPLRSPSPYPFPPFTLDPTLFGSFMKFSISVSGEQDGTLFRSEVGRKYVMKLKKISEWPKAVVSSGAFGNAGRHF